MLNQPKFSIAYEIEREDQSYKYTSEEKAKTIVFKDGKFQDFEIKPLKGNYYGYKFEIFKNGKSHDFFYKKINAKKAIFEQLEES